MVVNHSLVNGGDGHEQIVILALRIVKYNVPNFLIREFWNQSALGPAPESSVHNVHDAVDMVKGQHIRNMVIFGPAPRFLQ